MTKQKLILLFAIATIIATADLYTKRLAFDFVPRHGDTYEVIDGTFWIANHRNTGGMWGIGQEWPPWILKTVRLLAVAVIFLILAQTAQEDRIGLVALGLVLGGAVGNIYDSITSGSVRDFLLFDFGFPPFHPFPTFNLADSAICVGVGLLAIQMLRQPSPEEARPDEAT